MKTSSILLAIIVLVTLTGMVATNVLLKQQYDKVDWSNPYQEYEKRSLPTAKHWVIEGAPTSEIIIERSTGVSQALIEKETAKDYRTRQQGDTIFVFFTPDYSGGQNPPRADAERGYQNGIVLQLLDFQSLTTKNARLTLRNLVSEQVTVALENSRLRTDKLTIAGTFSLTASQNSFAVLGSDRYGSLQTVVEDSSGVQLNDTHALTFTKQLSPKAEIRLRGQALKWLK